MHLNSCPRVLVRRQTMQFRIKGPVRTQRRGYKIPIILF
ncbi:hypothetical protein LEP1GSC178_1655 [Leptospira licerasiae str. MMD4847]|uniref:Uncharacterized protein n=1 Tax=Leptospira licerasiae str. MMD4847 TaxID=1049971 RepID=A0ABP2R890_9LEPT|nr:hypothetical protein LEP1GSC178_1655 [Leptospira licerasiae str. MMD4847]